MAPVLLSVPRLKVRLSLMKPLATVKVCATAEIVPLPPMYAVGSLCKNCAGRDSVTTTPGSTRNAPLFKNVPLMVTGTSGLQKPNAVVSNTPPNVMLSDPLGWNTPPLRIFAPIPEMTIESAAIAVAGVASANTALLIVIGPLAAGIVDVLVNTAVMSWNVYEPDAQAMPPALMTLSVVVANPVPCNTDPPR